MFQPFFVGIALVACVSAQPAADEVVSLPGWHGPLPSRHFSGLLPTGNSTGSPGKLHYWLIESEANPKTDPIVLWLNGGPGSSSLIGLLTENGQLMLNDASLPANATADATPELFYNKYSWSRKANMLYLEQPKGVGFSFCDAAREARKRGADSASSSSKCMNDDASTAVDAHEALVNFFKSYPTFSRSAFYIAGESYAGTYIPMLMDEIDRNGELANFKGSMIGNGCWGSECFYGMSEPEIDYHIWEGHAMIPQTLKAQIDATCNDFEHPSKQCAELLDQSSDVAGDFNVYNIYDVCNGDDSAADASVAGDSPAARSRHARIRAAQRNREQLRLSHPAESYSPHPQLRGALNDFACGGQPMMEKWLARADVMKALHVDADTGGMRYNANVGDITTLYKRLVKKYRVLIYSGDVDGCVPYWGTERFVASIGGDPTKAWHAWRSNSAEDKGSVVAGYATGYAQFDFVTVKGAGHMVPTFKPRFALTMFENFLADKRF